MEEKERILFPKFKPLGGANLPHKKGTAEHKSVIMPPPAEVRLPLLQNIGAECQPVVQAGDEVRVGTKIGDTDKFMGVPVYSSVSGKVKEIVKTIASGREVDCVIIESDGKMTPAEGLGPVEINTKEDVIKACRDCGLVGLGGAGFPTHVKLSFKEGVKVDTLIVNGAECEPYITSDYRACMEEYDDVLGGVYLLLEKFGFERVVVAIENNKRPAIKKLYELVSAKNDPEDKVKLMELKSRYPQGAEKQLIYSVTGRRLGAGKLPSDVGCAIMNISTVASFYRYVRTGMPLVSRRVTVEGEAIKKPQNVIVPIGTPIKNIIDFCEGFSEEPEKILMGGPMMGRAIENVDDEVIVKASNAIVALPSGKIPTPTACIRCGRCAAHCPVKLYPSKIEGALFANDPEGIKKFHPEYCIECGCCAYSCPASRPLTQVMRTAKDVLRGAKK